MDSLPPLYHRWDTAPDRLVRALRAQAQLARHREQERSAARALPRTRGTVRREGDMPRTISLWRRPGQHG